MIKILLSFLAFIVIGDLGNASPEMVFDIVKQCVLTMSTEFYPASGPDDDCGSVPDNVKKSPVMQDACRDVSGGVIYCVLLYSMTFMYSRVTTSLWSQEYINVILYYVLLMCDCESNL